ncbi:hypothetical protein BT69DRAFT_1292944 [Atractiella rhizophila]|nr:hypothetical protein BT69DRAFT_1292944 [Atractiella rhizophila]
MAGTMSHEIVLRELWLFLSHFVPSKPESFAQRNFKSLREERIGPLTFWEFAIERLRNGAQVLVDDLGVKCEDREEAIKQKVKELREEFENVLTMLREESTLDAPDEADTFSKVLRGHRKPFEGCEFSTLVAAITLSQDAIDDSSSSPTAQTNETLSPLSTDSAKAQTIQGFLIEALEFTSMTYRKSSVESAHAKTFSWIFDNTHPSEFASWLEGNEGVYWISGKFGSGKSTLLNFIYDHPSMRNCLRKWAGEKKLSLARFFAWSSGALEQRSMRGLLRTLLHQILSEHTELVHVAFPSLFQQLMKMDTKERIKFRRKMVWELGTLMSGLRNALRASQEETKYCFFVDGLDEFEGEDQHGIISFLKDLARENVKICVSSRPWTIFEEAFADVKKMYLQRLTLSDMTYYFEDQFTAQVNLDHVPSVLVKETVHRSQGVFLWLTLVVKCLREDVSNSAAAVDEAVLLRFLRAYPSDLDDLFRYLLFTGQPKSALKNASRLFQLLRAKEVVGDLLKDDTASSLRELGEAEHDEVICSSIERADAEETWDNLQDTKLRVERNCAGLLKITKLPAQSKEEVMDLSTGERWEIIEQLADSKISYLHRTVRDFLVASPSGVGVWTDFLEQTVGESFDAHLSHLRSIILHLKRPYSKPKRHRWFDLLWEPHITYGLTHARFAEGSVADTAQMVELLDELHETLNWYWQKRKAGDEQDHWAKNAFGVFELRGATEIYEPFLSLAIKFGLFRYVEAKLRQEKYFYKNSKPRLSFAIDFLVHDRQTIYPLSSPELVQTIFKLDDSNANLEYREFDKSRPETPFIYCMKLLREANRRNWLKPFDSEDAGTKRWTSIVQLFLENGADPGAVIKADAWDPEITVAGVLDLILQRYGSREVKVLTTMLKGRN